MIVILLFRRKTLWQAFAGNAELGIRNTHYAAELPTVNLSTMYPLSSQLASAAICNGPQFDQLLRPKFRKSSHYPRLVPTVVRCSPS